MAQLPLSFPSRVTVQAQRPGLAPTVATFQLRVVVQSAADCLLLSSDTQKHPSTIVVWCSCKPQGGTAQSEEVWGGSLQMQNSSFVSRLALPVAHCAGAHLAGT